jgi:hypothetical protein
MSSSGRLVLAAALVMPLLATMGGAWAQQPHEQDVMRLPSEAGATSITRRSVTPHEQRSGIDGRVQLLASELDLNPDQQAAVRRILLQQRAEVGQVWSNDSQPAQVRVAATRAIGDRTAERIRAILNEEQREQYHKARPSLPDRAQSTDQVESWINAVGSH